MAVWYNVIEERKNKEDMHEEIEDYTPPYSPFDIFLVVLNDIIIIISFLPFTIILFYQGWQNDIAYMDSGPYRLPKIALFQCLLVLALLCIVSIKKSIYIKLVGSTCVFVALQWVTSSNIPNRALEYTLLSPLKEQCYALLKVIPVAALVFCTVLLILLTVFQHDLHFEPGETKANRIITFIIWILFLFIIPVVLRPFITIWL